MTTNLKPQITHKRATQRQHPRFGLPAKVDIDGNSYTVSNLSVGGVGVADLRDEVKPGDLVDVTIRFPFEGFEFSMVVKCEVRFQLPDRSVTGMQFVNISQRNLSLLHFVFDAYLAGEIVDAGDLLAIVQHENFTDARDFPKESFEETRLTRMTQFARRRIGAILFFAAAAALAAFIIGNLLTRAFVVRAEGKVVSLSTLTARAPQQGSLLANVVPLGARVAANSIIATLETNDGKTFGVKSTCDCLVAEQLAEGGEFLKRGAPVALLVPALATSEANLTVPLEDLRRIVVGDRVTARFYDGGQSVSGTVERITPPHLGAIFNAARTNFPASTGAVAVRLQTTLPAQRVGEPISARIRLSKLDPFG